MAKPKKPLTVDPVMQEIKRRYARVLLEPVPERLSKILDADPPEKAGETHAGPLSNGVVHPLA